MEDWIKQNKLTMSDALGDLVKPYDPQMALYVYQHASGGGSAEKVIQGFIETQQFDKIVPYCQSNNVNPDFVKILRGVIPVNPNAALGVAKMLTSREGGQMPRVPIDQVAQAFMEHNRIQETTAFLLEALSGNRPEEGHLQTRLFEINLLAAPNVAEAIFQMKLFSQYDREKVARLCEQAGLYSRALENYNSQQDIRRVMLNTHAISKEQLVEYFANMGTEDIHACMYDLINSNRQNVPVVTEIAVKYYNKIDIQKVIEIFQKFGSFDGLFFLLGNVLPQSEDPELYFKYIEAATKLNNFREVERVIKETDIYDANRVKEFLKEMKLPDPRPLIYLCDKHNFIPELTQYLYKNRMNKFIEVYIFTVNPNAIPQVLGALIDLDADEVYIKQLLNSIRKNPDLQELVTAFESRNKLRLLQGFLESRTVDPTPALHNALAKIYIDINKDPQDFLLTDQYYEPKEIGKYCEERNPDLAFLAYKQANGSCDYELIELSNKNYFHRMQARYLVERKNSELWAHVLREDNAHRRQVIEQVVQNALPDCRDPDQIQEAVKAFMEADMPSELIELLEKIVLHKSDFCNNTGLQNLLIFTAIKADKTRVMDYINRLDNYDASELAGFALKPEYGLHEEAFVIYKRANNHVEAIRVLLQYMNDLPQATEYAEKINVKEVWSELARSQVMNQLVPEAIESFIKANDPSAYEQVIQMSEQTQDYQSLVPYLLMARETLKESMIDGEIVYAYAQCNMLPDLEAFIDQSHQADVQRCGDRCFDERMYQAAKILFSNIGNNARLAATLVKLREFQGALQAAKKANTPKVWKEVNFACARAKEFRLAAIAGNNVIIHPDHLDDVISHYEKFGFQTEVIQLLENGLALERSHMGIYTELGIMYAKHIPEKLMDHVRTYCQKVNIPKLIRACERYRMWQEAVFLNTQYDEYDNAVLTMMEHSPIAWRHDLFVQNILKVNNQDLYYRAMIFYLEEEPLLLNDLLKLLAMKIDLTKAVTVMRRTGHLALITPFLRSVQNQNVSAVNEALNEIHVENDDHESLFASIKEYDSFESLNLAGKTESHELLEFRRIAALIYRKNKKYQRSIDICKKDKLWKDAMETVAESKDGNLCEQLMRFIIDMDDKELFAAMLYTCYEVIKPDVVLEIAWRFGLLEYIVPYFIQFVKDLSMRVDTVQKKADDIQKKEEKQQEDMMQGSLDPTLNMEFIMPGF